MEAIDSRIQQIYDQIDVYQAVAQDDYGVPAWQALPVASAPEIAFRPACSQLEPVWQVNRQTAWVWEGQPIYTVPGQINASADAMLNLQAAGVCVTGSHAVEVPLVATDEVFTRFQDAVSGGRAVAAAPPVETQPVINQPTQVVATVPPASGGGGLPVWFYFTVGLFIIGVAGIARHLHSKPSPGTGLKNKNPQPNFEPKNQPATDSDLPEYDFRL